MSLRRHMHALALAATGLVMGCAGIGWGEGGAEPTRATTGAFVKTFDATSLERASQRLDERVAVRWADGALMTKATDGEGLLDIDWRTWLLVPGAPRLELAPQRSTIQSSNVPSGDFGLRVHVPLASAVHEIQLSAEFLDLPCTISVTIADGEIDVPMSFTADKLGRIQGVVLAGATFHSTSEVTPNAILKADLSACVGAVDPGAHLAALGQAFTDAAVRAVGDVLAGELPAALGLDVAFGWSAAVNADALGTGFLRTALRGLASELVMRQAEAVQVAFALTIEADPHPCMAPFALAVPRVAAPTTTLPPGAALHIESLERMVAASWLAGATCAEHLGVIPIASAPLAAAWPALERLGPDAEVSLELWPASLPRVTADPDMVDGVVLETGRLRAEIMVSYAGARWRAATVVVDLSIAGGLWVDDAGAVSFDPAAIEATPLLLEAGLLSAPEEGAIAALLPPLVEALVLGRPLARVPTPLAPLEEGAVTVSGDYLSWPTR